MKVIKKSSFLILIFTFVPVSIGADSSVFLNNGTGQKLYIVYSNTFADKNVSRSGYITGPTSINAGQLGLIVQLSRGGAYATNGRYEFTQTITLPNDLMINFLQRIDVSYIALGPLRTSNMEVSVSGQGWHNGWLTDGDGARLVTKDWKKLDAPIFALTYQWSKLPNVDGYKDITYSIFPAGKVTSANNLRVLQYNIQQRPAIEGIRAEAVGLHSQRSRLSTIGIPQAIAQYNADVVTINEAFTAALRPELAQEMCKQGYIYATDVLNASSSKFWSGGVMIFSKYPIIKQAEHEFINFGGQDANAAKGVLYVQINKLDKVYNIFATHTNATYDFENGRAPITDEGRSARAKQFAELKQFIDRQKISKNQPVIIAGDMNVDMVSEKDKPQDAYAQMLTTLNAVHPSLTGRKYTLDETSNSLVEAGEGQQLLDYVLYAKDYKQPINAFNQPLCLKEGGKDLCTKDGVQDLSDHYPVLAVFEFADK